MKSKLIAVLGVAAIALTLGVAQADIGFTVESGGVYGAGGSFAAGPYPAAGYLYQVIWSPVAPASTDLAPALANPGESILREMNMNAPANGYGYVQTIDLGTIVVAPADIAGADPKAGFVYTRLFMDAAPVIGSTFQQGPAVSPALWPDYVPTDPSSRQAYNSTGNAPGDGLGAEANGVVIPEPATLGLLGLGLATILVRRRIRG